MTATVSSYFAVAMSDGRMARGEPVILELEEHVETLDVTNGTGAEYIRLHHLTGHVRQGWPYDWYVGEPRKFFGDQFSGILTLMDRTGRVRSEGHYLLVEPASTAQKSPSQAPGSSAREYGLKELGKDWQSEHFGGGYDSMTVNDLQAARRQRYSEPNRPEVPALKKRRLACMRIGTSLLMQALNHYLREKGLYQATPLSGPELIKACEAASSWPVLRAALDLPSTVQIDAVTTQAYFQANEVGIRMAGPDFPEVEEGTHIPQVQPVYIHHGSHGAGDRLLEFHGWSRPYYAEATVWSPPEVHRDWHVLGP